VTSTVIAVVARNGGLLPRFFRKFLGTWDFSGENSK